MGFLTCYLEFKMYIVCVLLFLVVNGLPDSANLRQLLQNYQQNQELLWNLGTRYEVVYPVQFRQDWVKGLSTRVISEDNMVTHLPHTSIYIDAAQFKFHLELELNTNLLAPTLVQILFLADEQLMINKDVENCYYHATVRNHTYAVAALHTCNGIEGVIYFGKDIFLIHPLFGDHSVDHSPHLLYHYVDGFEQEGFCGNGDADETFHCLQERLQLSVDVDILASNKYLELALVLDKAYFEKYNSAPKDVIASAVQIINCADLLFRPLNTSISVVYLELWAVDQIFIDTDIYKTLENFQIYAVHKFSRISIDAALLLTSARYDDEKNGVAITDSICTVKAASLAKVDNIYKFHLSSFLVAHMLGHNLGMYHDHKCCQCPYESGCIMTSSVRSVQPSYFSSCSVEDYFRTLRKGYGVCLFNMPNLRESVCGNGIVEKEEECDCGTSEECSKKDSCCDPLTCKFVKHAQCSFGPCCRKCKLLSQDQMCRPSRGECDIPEFCDGENGQCPDDLYKKNGIVCNDGLSYCYFGQCPSLRQQCESFWGYGADASESICYEQLNVQGTPNGNCGLDDKGGLLKCSPENSHCGSLHCQQGRKAPVTEQKPIQFIVNKITTFKIIYECKVIPSMSNVESYNYGLVEDGTKCGYQKLCVNQSCISIKSISSGSCPTSSSLHLVCSGHGACTNINTCVCEEGWTGYDCSAAVESPKAHEVLGVETKGKEINPAYTEEEDNSEKRYVKDGLIITIVIASILIGLALLTSVVLILMYSKNILSCKSGASYKTYK